MVKIGLLYNNSPLKREEPTHYHHLLGIRNYQIGILYSFHDNVYGLKLQTIITTNILMEPN